MSEAELSPDELNLVQDYWREWHVVARALGNDRWLTLCERVVAEREPVPLWSPAGEFRLCEQCREGAVTPPPPGEIV